jgi:hypothetical protein
MPTVGFTTLDVLRELQSRFVMVEPAIVAAYMQYEDGNRITVTTLLEDFAPKVEAEIAEIELMVCRRFEDYSFVFDTIHLKGRDAKAFIRPGATSLLVDRTTRARQAIG